MLLFAHNQQGKKLNKVLADATSKAQNIIPSAKNMNIIQSDNEKSHWKKLMKKPFTVCYNGT